MKNVVSVAVAVIENANGEILISRRQAGQHLAGYWEFPGGKIERGETVEGALIREIREELALTISPDSPLLDVTFQYPEKTVCLHTWLCSVASGEVFANEGQEWRWVARADLLNYRFPEANEAIITKLIQCDL